MSAGSLMAFPQVSRSATLASLVALTLGLTVSCGDRLGVGCQPQNGSNTDLNNPPDAWNGSPTESVDVTISDNSGVEIAWRGTQFSLQLPGESGHWRATRSRDLILARGRKVIPAGDTKGILEVSLYFARGNPQISVRAELDVPERKLEKPVDITLEFPAGGSWYRATNGKRHTVTPHVHIQGWRYPWLQFAPSTDASESGERDDPRDGGGGRITLWGWNGEDVRLDAERGSHSTVTLRVWRPTASETCVTDDDEPTRAHAETTLALGAPPPTTVSTLPSAHRSALVPVFLPPKTADDPQLWRGGPEDAGDWVERLDTLAHGHSNPDDPRYGNGGLLGARFGATLTWPAELYEAEAFADFRRHIASAPVDLAAPLGKSTDRDDVDERANDSRPVPRIRSAPETSAGDDLDCSDLQDGSMQPDVLLRDGPTVGRHLPTPLSVNDSIDEGKVTVPVGERPVIADIAHTDGTRSTVTHSLLSAQTVDRLTEHREVMVFGIPLVATRNPLLPAFDQGLLSPERNHQWTVQRDFSSALTTIDLAAEPRDFTSLSLGRLVEYWRRARRTSLRWSETGDLEIVNPAKNSIPDYGLRTERPAPAEDSLSETLNASETASGTKLNWELPADGSTHIQWNGASDDAEFDLAPVEWQIESQ